MIEMVVFDMAGTTVNENNVVYKTLQKAINNEGFNFTLNQVLEVGAGKEKLQAIKSILQIFAQNDEVTLANKMYQNFIAQLELAYDEMPILPQNNADKLFKELKDRNILVILNTGYNEHIAHKILNKLHWQIGKNIDGVITATDVQNNRPQPDMILLAMKNFNIIDAKNVIKIGDSIIDIEEGINAGCSKNIGITTGAHTFNQLQSANPDYIINDLIELLPILDEVI